jgi:predicted MFS family arabinose efflux permease
LLPQAAAQNEAAFGAASIAGPSIGTLLYQTLGKSAPFLADAISYAASVVSLLFIKTDFRPKKAVAAPALRAEIVEGLHWLWRKPLIRYMAFLTGGLNLVNAAVPLIVIILAKEMGARDIEIGLIFSIGGLGGVVGSLVGGRIQKRFSFGQVVITVVWLEAMLFPLYALVPQFYLLGVIFALLYTLSPIYNVVQFSYRLSLIPDGLQGRVNSTFRLIAFGFMPLGAAIAGFLLEWMGAVPTILAFTAWYLMFAILTTLNDHVRNAAPLAGGIAERKSAK